MNIEELVKQLNAPPQEKDGGVFTEGHIAADRLLLTYINDMAVTMAFSEVGKWYE